MTVLASRGFDGGPNGAAVTAGANELVVKTGTASLTYSSLAPITGAYSARVQAASGEYCYLVEKFTATGTAWYQVLFTTPPSAPTVALFLVGVFSGNTPAMDVRLNPDMTLTIRDRLAASSVARWTSPVLPFNTRIRATGKCTPAGGATALRGKLYVGETALAGTTATHDSGDLLSGSSLTQIDQVHTGVLYATTSAWAVEFDALSIETAEPGPVAVNSIAPPVTDLPPVVDAGNDVTVYPGTGTVTLTAVASDPGGGISTYAWRAITTGAPQPVGTGAVRTLTSPVLRFDKTYTYGVVVTDTSGQNSPESTLDVTFKATTEWHCSSTGVLQPMTIVSADGTALTYPPNYGAIGSYKPGSTTTGVPTTTVLTQQTGDMIVTTPGTVLNGLDIHGRVLVRAANVTIQRCVVRGRSSAANESCIDATNAACVGLVVQDCDIVPEFPSIWVNGINGHDFTARRLNIRNVVDGFGIYNTNSPGTATNVVLEQNWVHDLAYFTPDVNHSSDNQTHNDGVQIQGGTGVIIRGNFIDSHYGTAGSGQPTPTANPTPSGATSPALSCVLFNVNVGTTASHLITDNWFSGGYIPINCGGAPGVNLGTMWRNRFGRDSLVTSGTPQTILLRADQTCDTGDGTANQNVFDDNGAAVLVRHNG